MRNGQRRSERSVQLLTRQAGLLNSTSEMTVGDEVVPPLCTQLLENGVQMNFYGPITKTQFAATSLLDSPRAYQYRDFGVDVNSTPLTIRLPG